MTIKDIKNCIICKSKLKSVINLPNYPITEVFSKKKTTNKKFFINQKIMFCNKCQHISLKNIINQDIFYKDYKMRSKKSSQHAGEYLTNFFEFIKKNVKKDFYKKAIIDIGGNDSTFLNLFKNKVKINIDPNASGDRKIIKEKRYFEKVNFNKFKKFDKIYVSSHTIEHLVDINDLIKKISRTIKIGDFIFLQFPSFELFIKNLRFDQITHQHLNLYSLNSISKILNKHSLFVRKFEFDESVYGTLRLFVKKSKKRNYFMPKIKAIEIKKKFKKFTNFYKSLNKVLEKKGVLIGFGAGLMVPTLNYYLPIVNKLKFILDSDRKKKDKFFINMKPQIKYFNGNFKNYRKSQILITSISTESTLEKICKKLTENSMNFYNPSINK